MPAFKYPRTSQPQGAVEIDWSNPITRGLALSVGGTGVRNEATSRQTYARNGAVSSIGKSGVGITWPNAGSPGLQVSSSQLLVGRAGNDTGGITILTLANPAASSGVSMLFSMSGGTKELYLTTNSNASFSSRPGDLALILNSGGSCIANGVLDGNPHVFVSTITEGLVPSIFVDGINHSSSQTAATLLGGSGSREYIGGYSGSGYSVNKYQVFETLAWNRVLSSDEIKSISDNPWQLFKPVSRTLWIPGTVSGGGAVNYTLSAVAGGYSVSGNAATLTYAAGSASHAYSLTAASGVYALSGKPSTLTYTSVGPVNYTLTAAKGAYSVVGSDASFAFSGAKGGGFPRKKFQIETAQGVIAVDSLAEASRIIARAKKSASKPVVTLQGIKVAAPTKKTLDCKAIEARMRAEIQAEIDDEEDLLMML